MTFVWALLFYFEVKKHYINKEFQQNFKISSILQSDLIVKIPFMPKTKSLLLIAKSKKFREKVKYNVFGHTLSFWISKAWNLKNLWSSYHDDRTAHLPQDNRNLSKHAPTKMTTNSLIPNSGELKRQLSVQSFKTRTLNTLKAQFILPGLYVWFGSSFGQFITSIINEINFSWMLQHSLAVTAAGLTATASSAGSEAVRSTKVLSLANVLLRVSNMFARRRVSFASFSKL